jgi:hypothetical protein
VWPSHHVKVRLGNFSVLFKSTHIFFLFQVYEKTSMTSCNCTLNCPRLDHQFIMRRTEGTETFRVLMSNECAMLELNVCTGTNCKSAKKHIIIELKFILLEGTREENLSATSEGPMVCPRVCGEVDDPVCATNGQVNQTFGNLCLMNSYNKCTLNGYSSYSILAGPSQLKISHLFCSTTLNTIIPLQSSKWSQTASIGPADKLLECFAQKIVTGGRSPLFVGQMGKVYIVGLPTLVN